MKHLLLFSLLAMSTPALAEGKSAWLIFKNNYLVARLLSAGNFKGAKDVDMNAYLQKNHATNQEFVSMLAKWPFDLTLQFNVGSTLETGASEEQFAKTEALFSELLKQIDLIEKKERLTHEERLEAVQVRFAIYYNMGVYYQMREDRDKALSYYQKALDMSSFDDHPGHLEIKTNIEMLFSSGDGKGKSKNKDDKKEGEGGDQSDQNQDQDQKDGKDNKDPKDKKDEKDQKEKPDEEDKDQKKKRPFDEKQMSNEDLQRIMEELKQQEQAIRAKSQGKGGKNADNEKNW